MRPRKNSLITTTHLFFPSVFGGNDYEPQISRLSHYRTIFVGIKKSSPTVVVFITTTTNTIYQECHFIIPVVSGGGDLDSTLRNVCTGEKGVERTGVQTMCMCVCMAEGGARVWTRAAAYEYSRPVPEGDWGWWWLPSPLISSHLCSPLPPPAAPAPPPAAPPLPLISSSSSWYILWSSSPCPLSSDIRFTKVCRRILITSITEGIKGSDYLDKILVSERVRALKHVTQCSFSVGSRPRSLSAIIINILRNSTPIYRRVKISTTRKVKMITRGWMERQTGQLSLPHSHSFTSPFKSVFPPPGT